MKNILEDLFEGDLAGRKETFSDDPAYQEAIDWVVRTEDALRAALPAPSFPWPRPLPTRKWSSHVSPSGGLL